MYGTFIPKGRTLLLHWTPETECEVNVGWGRYSESAPVSNVFNARVIVIYRVIPIIILGGQPGLLVVATLCAAACHHFKIRTCSQVNAGDAEHLFLLRLWFFW